MTNPTPKGLEDAERAYQGFHWGRPPKRRVAVRLPKPPRALVKLGTLEAVTYSTVKGREGFQHYEHEFGEEGGQKPVLAMDPASKRLHVIGGTYTVEDRGIVD